ncbi:hypothetical protein ACLKA6_016725 [Drosophila palustris]
MAGGPVSARTEDWILRQQGLVKVLSAQGLKTGSDGSKDGWSARTEDWIRRQQGWLEVLSAQGLKTGSRGSKDGWRSCQRKD